MTQQAPKYGEYATPEEQRRLAGLPPVGPEPAPAPEAEAQTAPAEPRSGAGVDRLITIALLAYGLVNVVMTAISYLDLPSLMDQMLAILGSDASFTNYTQGRLWGGIAAAVLVVGYALTATFAIRRLRRKKMAWWVPVVGAAATVFVVSLCLMVPMLSDPAFVQAVMPPVS